MIDEPAPPSTDLSASLAEMFPAIPLQSVVRCVLDAQSAVEYAGVERDDRSGLVEELAPFYADAE